MEKETKTMEIMEEEGNEVLINGSDSEGRVKFAYRFFPRDVVIGQTSDEEYLNVFRDNLHIRVERRCEDPGYCDPYEYPAPEYRIIETDSRTGEKLVFRVELEKVVKAE